MALKIYPVGSIYMSVNNTSPENLFGGTWEKLENCFLLAASEIYPVGKTGGESEHTLTYEEMPSHAHPIKRPQWYSWDQNYPTGAVSIFNFSRGADNVEKHGVTQSAGGSKPHNNMPPYLSVYMWKRIA